MRKRRGALLAVAACAGAVVTVPSSAAASGAVERVGGCAPQEARPFRVILACGDANVGLVNLRWTEWGGRVARGYGMIAANDCEPYCAAGTFHRYRVSVVAYRAGDCGGTRAYKRMRWTFSDWAPTDVPTHWGVGCPL